MRKGTDSEQLYRFIEHTFRTHQSELFRAKELCVEISSLIDGLSLFVQRHTEQICPHCENVCCINKHSYNAYDDIVYLCGLGERIVPRKKGIADSEACQFLGEKGCTIRHSLRPYRCTWYFCSPLLEQIGMDELTEYRKFISLLELITRTRGRLLDEFEGVLKTAGNQRPSEKKCYSETGR